MFSEFVHRRPLLRAFLACVLMAGLLGTAAATHAGMSYVAGTVVDAAGHTLDIDDGAAGSAEDNCVDDTLVVPAAIGVAAVSVPVVPVLHTHRAPARWHANFELRPPIG
jgi:hypothetical protein